MRANERRMRLIEELCERKFDTIDNLAFELGVSRNTRAILIGAVFLKRIFFRR